ncbi:MAG: T9SS type A sorting domain-containing protein [Bacteroidetes bacterium]|nr:T9SS type A sorting domain-containing protein [Bacteroidota bacterium]
MMLKIYSILLTLFILIFLISSPPLRSQTLKAVNDTMDLYPGVPKTVNLLDNDTVPYGDSIKVTGGGSPGSRLITITYNYIGFITYLVKPYWGFNGNQAGSYTILDYTLGTSSNAHILFRIHDHSYDSLDINNVKAGILAYGNELNFYGSSRSLYRVPKNSQNGTFFSFVPWIGGKGDDSMLYLAAERYRQGATGIDPGLFADFYAGPVMDSVNYSVCQDTIWNRVWKIRKTEIDYHKTHWDSPGYITPVNIREWPGNGNPAFGQAARLAPYHDYNSDGKYDATDGDYPLIKGDEAVFAIFNDDRSNHLESGGRKMKVEIHAMAYAFDMPDDSAFKNTIFMNYQIYNRSNRTYYKTYLGLFADFDIGWYGDDYIGCDVERSSFFGFNGKINDGTGQTGSYGPHAPAQSITILGGPLMDPSGHDRPRLDLSGHRLCNESINGTGFGDSIADNERYGLTNFLPLRGNSGSQLNYMSDPLYAVEYYHALQSIWHDSTHLIYGGQGHSTQGGYGPDCRFMYPGESDSLNWGTGCRVPDGPVNWTAQTTGVEPYDIRGAGSMGPFTFHPGDLQKLDIAFVFARDYTGQDSLYPSVDKLRQMIDIVRNSYNTGTLPNGGSFFGVHEQPLHSSPAIKIYPNPANEKLNIIFDKQVNEKVRIQIINSRGIVIYSSDVIVTSKEVQLDVRGVPSGIYIINIRTKNFIATGKAGIIN